MSRPLLPDEILAGRLIAIGRRLDPGALTEVVDVLAAEGVRVFELTLDGEGALEAIAELAGGPTLVGAGTVMSIEEAERAVAAGAGFVVSPHTDESMVGWAVDHGVPFMAGAFTPTEVTRAWAAGASAVKLFPASVGGPRLVRELRGPFRDVPFVPTGGIDAAAAGEYLAAGAVAVGVGSWLTRAGTADETRHRARLLVEACSAPS